MDEPYSRFASASKGRPSWEDGDPNLLPRSPLAYDQQHHQQPATLPRQRRTTASLGPESSSKQSKVASTLSTLQTSRAYTGNRHPADRGVSVTIGQQRSPYSSGSKFFLTVIPPADLPHDPPHPRSQASTSSSSHLRRGTLLPLYPTLGGQLYAISREYGLPSIGGLSIYLCDDGEGNLGPRIGDAAWSALWNRFFDESADDLYVDITSPQPLQRYSTEEDRRFSGTSSSEMQSPYADNSGGLKRDTDNYECGFLNDQRRPSSSMRTGFANGNSASPMAYNTPSPRHPRFQRSFSRTSLRATTPLSAQARLPIVGRIEWAVDKNRAAWWSNWIGEADVSSERSVSSFVTSQRAGGSARKGPARRSLHLTSSLPRPRTDSSAHGTVLQRQSGLLKSEPIEHDEDATDPPREYGAPRETLSGTEKSATSAMSSPLNSIINIKRMGYKPIDDVEDQEPQQTKSPEQSFDDAMKVNGMPGYTHSGDELTGEASYESQSYAGYSALLGVDDETRAQDTLSSMTGKEEQTFQTRPLQLANAVSKGSQAQLIPREAAHPFNADLLTESDGEDWRLIREDYEGHKRAVLPDHPSSRSLGEQKELSAVHEWIAKTQSPQSGRAELDLGKEEEEESLLPPQDDVEEVLGLWAEKTREVHSTASPTMLQLKRTSQASTSKAGQVKVVSHRNSSRISSPSSKRSPSVSPRLKQSPLQQSSARLADMPEETPTLNQPTVSKASLLSPIALDNSPATFAGPSAKLGNLLGTSRSTLGPNDEHPYPTTRQSTIDSTQESETSTLSRNNTLSSPRLELPDPRSPGAASRASSELSDTLLDMERALALLSPAVSHKNQDSPAMGGTSTAESTYDSGVLTSAVRVKMPLISSKESMAKARTLSSSVTPSPRWFRNTTPALPRLAQSNSDRSLSGPELPGKSTSQDGAHKLSPRPSSAFASSRSQDPLTAWNFPAPVSAAKLVEQVTDEGQVTKTAGESSEEDVRRDIKESDDEGSDDDRVDGPAEEEATTAHVLEFNDDGVAVAAATPVTISSLANSAEHTHMSANGQRESLKIYDSPVQELQGAEKQWLQPEEHLGRQGWSETTGEASRMFTTGDSTLPEDESTDQPAITTSDLPSGVHTSSAISASFSPRSGQYATVGVQAERDNASRTNSLFSLVSDGASNSQASRMAGDQEGDGEDDRDEEEEVRKEVDHRANTLQTPTLENTPQMGRRPRMDRSGHSSVDIAPSIQRLIRGNSFAASSEASSTHANSPYIDSDRQLRGTTMKDFDWSRFGMKTPEGEEEGKAEDITVQQQQHEVSNGIQAEEEHTTTTTTSRDTMTNESSFDAEDGEDWSQSGSDFGDDASNSPATRGSRLSGYSHRNGAGISDAGGRTPTFFYDSHLTDEESASRRASRRMSGNRRSSSTRKSLRLSRAPLRPVEYHDALGVGLYPAHSATISNGADHRDNLSVFGGSVGDTSHDSNRHDVVSLAGEMLEGHDDTMLQGFEHVSPKTQESRDDSVNEAAKQDDRDSPAKLQALSGFALTGGMPNEGPSTPLDKNRLALESRRRVLAELPRSSNGTGVVSSLRRSMGSIKDDRTNGAITVRRASASATSPGKNQAASSLHSPRRFRGAMLRLGAIGSPNQRFRALPPSPSLPAKRLNGKEASISHGDLANGMPHTNAMVSPQTIFSSVDSMALTDGLTSSDSADRNTFASSHMSHSPMSQ